MDILFLTSHSNHGSHLHLGYSLHTCVKPHNAMLGFACVAFKLFVGKIPVKLLQGHRTAESTCQFISADAEYHLLHAHAWE